MSNITVGKNQKVHGRWTTLLGDNLVSALDFDVQVGESISIPQSMTQDAFTKFVTLVSERREALKILLSEGVITKEKYAHINDVSNLIIFMIRVGTKIESPATPEQLMEKMIRETEALGGLSIVDPPTGPVIEKVEDEPTLIKKPASEQAN